MRIALVLLTLLTSAGPAFANPIVDHHFAGAVETDSVFLPSMPVGTEVSFTVPFDFGATDVCAAFPLSGEYFFPGSTISYGGTTYTSQFTALEVNAPDGNCSVASVSGYTVRMLNFAGAPFSSATFDFGSLIVLNDGVPAFPSGTLGAFSVNYVGHGFGGLASAVGTIELISVPEPGLAALFTLAAAAIGIRRRGRVRHVAGASSRGVPRNSRESPVSPCHIS